MRRAQKTGFPDQCSYEYKNGLSGQKQDFFMNKLNRHSDNYRELMLLKIDIKLRHGFRHFAFFLKWLAIAAFLGVVCGLTGALFHYFIDEAAYLFGEYGFLLYFLPAAGLLTVFSYHSLDIRNDEGTNSILRAARAEDTSAFRVTPLIFIATFLTHLCGGSAGREGAALQLGGAISGNIGHLMHLDDKDSRTITMCGMAACFSALFGTPLAASVFAMEVISVGVMYYAALFPSILASVIAHQVALQLGGGTTAFTLSGVPENTDVLLIVKLVAFGVVCAGLSALVCVIFHKIGHLFKHFLPNQYACIAVGGAVVVLISLLLGTRDYNGAGMQVIERAIAGHAAYEAFFLKLVLTAITIGVGYKGGEIVPVLFIGATFGAAYGGFFGLAPSFAAGLGMTAVFCGVTNSPLTSILLAYELFGGQSLALFALVIAIAYMLSGYYGLYSEQKIIYSKLQPRYIDRKTK